MAELKATEVKYGVPLVTTLGAVKLTATHIEFPASAETITGGVELNLKKLGLTDEAVLGNSPVAGPEGATGEVATTTPNPFAAWTSGLVVEESTAAKGEAIVKAVPVVLTRESSKLFLRFLAVPTLKKVWLEITTAEKANGTVGACGCTVFVLGK